MLRWLAAKPGLDPAKFASQSRAYHAPIAKNDDVLLGGTFGDAVFFGGSQVFPKGGRDAFVVRLRRGVPLVGQHLALVDDVMTSGATLRAAATALRRAGAARVDAWVVARTPAPTD